MYFECVELIGALIFAWMAWRGEESTALRPERMMMLASAVAYFGFVRVSMVFRRRGWAGAYRVDGEE